MSSSAPGQGADALRALALRRLPKAARTTLAAYAQFVTSEHATEDPKSFAGHHAAAKAALSHFEVIVKLIQWAEGDRSETQDPAPPDTAELIARARARLDAQDQAPPPP